MKRFLRDNGLSLAFGLAFLLTLGGQALAGYADFTQQQVASGGEAVGLATYVTSSSFGVDVAENWQSEYLQFFLYTMATVWLLQRGSPESKPLGDAGRESDEEQAVGRYAPDGAPPAAEAGGVRTLLYSRSLGLVVGLVFLASWTAQSVAGWAAFNAEQLADRQDPVSWTGYLGEPDFWNRTLQNWQSELLAVGSFAVLAVFLRERGSPESKRVGAPHDATADTG
ncbi:hypothetical protein GCM10023215_12840 [Pseudonocardia yuanmonensis]|uniref:Uncharacterized protein n=1 Tax=Pseudonocardia yuanmonensis TaxID=1095914 RepID=A0ABP8W733_9PSEU